MAYQDTSRLRRKVEALRSRPFGGSYGSGLANAIVGLKANRVDEKLQEREKLNEANRAREMQALLQAVSGKGQVGGLGPNLGIPQTQPLQGNRPAELSDMQFTDPQVRDLATSTALSQALKQEESGTFSPLLAIGPNGQQTTIFRDNSRPGFFDSQGRPFDASDVDVYNMPSIQGERAGVVPPKVTDELEGLQIATQDLIDMGNDVIREIQTDPTAFTIVGKAGALIDGVRQNVQALASEMGYEFEADKMAPNETSQEVWGSDSRLRELNTQESRIQSLITSLAYAQARSMNSGDRISNDDYRQALKTIGASYLDGPQAFAATLEDVMDRAERRFRTTYRVRKKEDFPGSFSRETAPEDDIFSQADAIIQGTP